jgi:UPF0042 nucleotide-binding protein
MKVKLSSFAYRSGDGHPPADATLVLDCRDLRNPYRIAALKPLTGLDAAVQDYVRCDPAHKTFIDRVLREAQYGGHIAFGCMGGRHRSVAMAELLAKELRQLGHQVTVVHTALS